MQSGYDKYFFQPNKNIIADFSWNIWNTCNANELKEIISLVWDKLNHYPESNAESVQQIIARLYAVHPSQVMVTNGAIEAIYTIASTFRNCETTIFYPAFEEYEKACLMHLHRLHFVHYNSLNESLSLPGGVCFICNPNSIDGRALSMEILKGLIQRNKYTIFIIDETYIDFTLDSNSFIPFISNLSNLIVIRSLSVKFGLPGLRLGFIVSGKDLIQKIAGYKYPWSVNAFAIEAGKYLLTHLMKNKVPLHELLSNTKNLRDSIVALGLFEIESGSTPFFLMKINKGTSAELRQFLINHAKILICDVGHYRGLTPQFARISVQEIKKNFLLIKALKQWVASIS
jgi:threonine-phosphate decarboxylase